MSSRWKSRAFRLAERPVEVWLVPASCLGEIVAAAKDAKDRSQRLSRDEAFRLFDGRWRESTWALRAFLRDNGLGPSLALSLAPLRERQLVSYVRQEIAVGALVAIRPVEERKRLTVAPRRAAPAPAPIPIRRAPTPAVEPEATERPEFLCPGPQAEALIAAAASGAPFCAECQRAAARAAAAAARA